MTDYLTITEIKKANTAAGRFWFSPRTVKFFKSKVRSPVYQGEINADYPQGSRLWIESTRNYDETGREFKIARFNCESADISWVSIDYKTLRFDTQQEALSFLTEHLKGQ